MKIRIVLDTNRRFLTIVNDAGEEITAESIDAEWVADGEVEALCLTVATPLDPATVLAAITPEEAAAILESRAAKLTPPKGQAEFLFGTDPIPEGVYFNATFDNFYAAKDRHGMGSAFLAAWYDRREEFPPSHPDDVPVQKQNITINPGD